MRTAGISALNIVLPFGRMTGTRTFSGPDLFCVQVENVAGRWAPSLSDLAWLRACVGTIRNQFHVADKRGERVVRGRVYRRPQADADTIIDLGILDEAAIYLQFFTARPIRLPDEEGEAFLLALENFTADVGNVAQAYGVEPSAVLSSGRTESPLAGYHRMLDRRSPW